MTDDGLRLIAAALAVGIGAVGPGVGIGVIFSGALQAMGRNPEAEGTCARICSSALRWSKRCSSLRWLSRC